MDPMRTPIKNAAVPDAGAAPRVNARLHGIASEQAAPAVAHRRGRSFDDAASNATKTLVRGLSILDCFGPDRAWLSLSEITQMTGLAKATAHRLVHTLEDLGWLSRNALHEYALSAKFTAKAAPESTSANMLDVARPIMRALAEETGQSVTLHTLCGRRRLWLEAVASTPILRAIHYSAQPVPLCLGAATLVLLASLPALEFESMLAEAAESAHCPAVELLSIVETTRRQGYAVSHGGGAAGITGIAAPVDTAGQHGLLCITVVLPTPAAKGQVSQLVAMTQGAAQRLSRRLAT